MCTHTCIHTWRNQCWSKDYRCPRPALLWDSMFFTTEDALPVLIEQFSRQRLRGDQGCHREWPGSSRWWWQWRGTPPRRFVTSLKRSCGWACSWVHVRDFRTTTHTWSFNTHGITKALILQMAHSSICHFIQVSAQMSSLVSLAWLPSLEYHDQGCLKGSVDKSVDSWFHLRVLRWGSVFTGDPAWDSLSCSATNPLTAPHRTAHTHTLCLSKINSL